MRRTNRGMTLIELLWALLIFTLALAALVSSLMAVTYFISLSREQSLANEHLRDMMERLRATPFNSVPTQFPGGVVDGAAGNRYFTICGGYVLGNEHITVNYPNVNADPLEIQVQLSWNDRYARAHQSVLSTFKTR